MSPPFPGAAVAAAQAGVDTHVLRSQAAVDAFVAALDGMKDRQVLVHCQVNMRGSSMVFLYRTIVGKESPEAAYEAVTKVWSPNGVWKQFIVDQLFVGNRLATAELTLQDGTRVDLRSIRSPILVFCSRGDDITPPAQALAESYTAMVSGVLLGMSDALQSSGAAKKPAKK